LVILGEMRSTSGGWRQMRAASMRASSIKVAPGTTRLTRPQASAVAASIVSPVKNNSAARAWPMVRGRIQAPPSPGTNPILRNVAPKIALSAAMRRSARQATSLPRPMAGPFTAAIIGTSMPHNARTSLWMPPR